MDRSAPHQQTSPTGRARYHTSRRGTRARRVLCRHDPVPVRISARDRGLGRDRSGDGPPTRRCRRVPSVLVARREERLAETRRSIRRLRDPGQPTWAPTKGQRTVMDRVAQRRRSPIDLVVNNAGFGSGWSTSTNSTPTDSATRSNSTSPRSRESRTRHSLRWHLRGQRPSAQRVERGRVSNRRAGSRCVRRDQGVRHKSHRGAARRAAWARRCTSPPCVPVLTKTEFQQNERYDRVRDDVP